MNNGPCKKDCPDRNYKTCKSCEKLKLYIEQRNKEYEKRKTESDFKFYEYHLNKKIRKIIKYNRKKGM